MKGPSLDAIRKFKEAQERKKREDDDRKIKEKLNTLQHRASQGDRKAKTELKKIEKVKDEQTKPAGSQQQETSSRPSHSNLPNKFGHHLKNGNAKAIARPKQKEADFEELMKLAKQNNNEMKRPEERKPLDKKPVIGKTIKKIIKEEVPRAKEPVVRLPVKAQVDPPVVARHRPDQQRSLHPKMLPPRAVIHRPIPGPSYSRMRQYDDDDDEYEEDDRYEDDGFIVDEDEDEARDELQRTLKSVFRYDRRRCDLREEELDRQYRAIGKVSTFEDLEREERRASRLAALEDAQAQREEEERKRLKKIRLKKG